MDASSVSLSCLGVVNDSIYFQEVTTEVTTVTSVNTVTTGVEMEDDRLSFIRMESKHLCYNRENQFLILNSFGQLEAKNLSDAELLLSESQFNIMIYNDSSKAPRRLVGRPVLLYCSNSQKKMVVCCSNYEIHVEEMEPQRYIDGSEHKALFYLIGLSASHLYMFESALHRNRFLACERENGALKLVLRENRHGVDEHSHFTLF